MANDNHESYNGVDICTYTDLITIGNTLTTAEVDACILAAGERPADDPRIIVTEDTPGQTAPNSATPFYMIGDALWYSEEELVTAKDTWFNYLHVLYAQKSQNALATQLEIGKYRNFVTITSHTETINSTPYTYYSFAVTTKYGAEGDWTESVLKPMYVLSDGDARTGLFIEEQMTKQEYNFSKSWGTSCTDLGYIQGRRNLKDNESGGIIEKAMWDAGLAAEAPYHVYGGTQYGDDYDHHLQWQNNPSTFYTASVINNIDDILFIVAIAGLKFDYNGTVYKPLVEQGVVIGYTDDMTQISEWDDWEDIGDHEIPVTPPAPVPPSSDDDNNDPISTTGAPFSSGLAHYYITTADSLVLSHISAALGSWNIKDTGKDLFKNLISCKLVKPPTAVPSNPGTFTIYGEQPEYEGDTITISEVTGNPDMTFGPYSISRKFNDFRDYAPYTRAEIFLPYCGWCGLPSHVIGRSVSVRYYTDIIAATCKAIVFCGNNIVAEASGVIGIDIPLSADAVGMKMAAAASGMLAIISGGVQTGIGAFAAMTGSPGKGLSTALGGLSKAAGGFTQSAMALNENSTEISGKNTDGCCIAGTTAIIIKITRPKEGSGTAPGKVPEGYAHNIGFISQKGITVGSVSGYLVASGVDTSDISGATEREKSLIKSYLESGVIV